MRLYIPDKNFTSNTLLTTIVCRINALKTEMKIITTPNIKPTFAFIKSFDFTEQYPEKLTFND